MGFRVVRPEGFGLFGLGLELDLRVDLLIRNRVFHLYVTVVVV